MSIRFALGAMGMLTLISGLPSQLPTDQNDIGVRRSGNRLGALHIAANGETQGDEDTVRRHRQKVAHGSKQHLERRTATNDGRPMCGRITSKERGRWEGSVSADGRTGVRMTYDLDSCRLHRYTPQMARKCLRGKHLVMVGDSLTRYQYLSLVHMLVKGEYPEPGIPISHPFDKPNVCQEGDYNNLPSEFMKKNGLHPDDRGWPAFMVHTSQNFRAQEHCDCWRGAYISNRTVENRFYKDVGTNLSVSYFTKNAPGVKIHGHYPSDGEELPPTLLTKERFERIGQTPLAWEADNVNFVNTVLPKIERDFGQIHTVLWNQGLWGREGGLGDFVKKTRAFFTKRNARAMWKSTTHPGVLSNDEMQFAERLRDGEFYVTESNGWDSLDATHILKNLTLVHPGKEHGQDVWNKLYLHKGHFSTFGSGLLEFNAVHWDFVHYRPWVYEELNNVWLNMLCNENV